jgi:hypothetical protein
MKRRAFGVAADMANRAGAIGAGVPRDQLLERPGFWTAGIQSQPRLCKVMNSFRTQLLEERRGQRMVKTRQ